MCYEFSFVVEQPKVSFQVLDYVYGAQINVLASGKQNNEL